MFLFGRCLEKTSDHRPWPGELLTHPFIKDSVHAEESVMAPGPIFNIGTECVQVHFLNAFISGSREFEGAA
jgi:hypothetical protein